MAYDVDMWNTVELIDELNGDLWPFIKRPAREIRLRTIWVPPTPTPSDQCNKKDAGSECGSKGGTGDSYLWIFRYDNIKNIRINA